MAAEEGEAEFAVEEVVEVVAESEVVPRGGGGGPAADADGPCG